MTHLLHIDASPRGERSHSRRMTREFVEKWQQQHPNDTIAYRDVGRNPIPHVDELWIAAAFSPPDQHTPQFREDIRLSNQPVSSRVELNVGSNASRDPLAGKMPAPRMLQSI